MKYAQLPREITRTLPFYLAMEEYVAINMNEDVFFTWQVEPTVIFGSCNGFNSQICHINSRHVATSGCAGRS